MTIDNEIFEKRMNQLIERLDVIEKELDKIIKSDWEDVLLDNQDLLHLLKISSRTLQRFRSSGLLPFKKIKKKNYYLKSEIQLFLNEYFGTTTKKINSNYDQS